MALVRAIKLSYSVQYYADVAEQHRLELCRHALMLLPDANRTAVYQLLTFLRHVSQQSQHNQVQQFSSPTNRSVDAARMFAWRWSDRIRRFEKKFAECVNIFCKISVSIRWPMFIS